MAYTLDTSHNATSFTKGRTAKIKHIVIHHWGSDGQTHDDVVAFFERGPGTSAHYVASAGRVSCIVDPDDTAWHAGNWAENCQSIGIECRPEMSDGDIATVAELIRDIRKTYGDLELHVHSEFFNTTCPGRWRDKLGMAALDKRARNTSGGSTPTVTPTPSHAASPAADGYWGSDTTRALQRVLGTPVDGVVSSQSSAWRSQNPGLTSGWEWVSDPVGSQLIAALQRKLGVTADGLIGPGTIRTLQKRMGTTQDGCLSKNSSCIIALQKRLQKGTI